jgi:RNA polymerase sigma factor (sigma-70 family)
LQNDPRDDGTCAGQVAEHFFRHEGARLVAVLTSHLGVHRLQLAEDVVQESLVRALQTWPYRGVPANPAAWLMRTAKNLALDTLRREQRFADKEDGIGQEYERWLAAPSSPEEGIADDRLRMMFVCFHPQLSSEMQTALALRTLCGFSSAEIAAAFLSTEAAIEKRLVRARQRIRELALPFAVPEPHELPARLDGVLHTLYLLFSEGYKASSGERLVRAELCDEAIRLALLLTEHAATRQPSTYALVALMLLNAARLPARTNDTGHLLRLHEQDRAAWHAPMIARGLHYLALAATGETLSEYHLQAGIAACHSTAPDAAHTDWPRILALYDRLVTLGDSPIVALNRAVAVARVHGPRAGLDALQRVRGLENYHLLHATRGTFEAELGHSAIAIAHFQTAEKLADLPSEKAFLAEQMRTCAEREGQH